VQPGDIILGVNGTRVKTAAELASAVSKRTGRFVSLLVQRGDNQFFIQVRVE